MLGHYGTETAFRWLQHELYRVGGNMLPKSKLETLARLGFAARAVIYVLIGYLALRSGRTEGGAGILEYLDSGGGRILLAIMAAGFLGYGLWRLSEAFADTEGHGADAKGVATRIGGAVSGLIHLGLSFYALKLISDGGGTSGGGGGAQEGASTALSLPGGPLLLILAGAALLVTGAYQLIKAVRAGFLKHLDPEAAKLDWVKWTGRAGYAARGVVFLIMGWFLIRAGTESRASEAGGLGEALSALPGTLQIVVAAGLLLFGLFSAVEARFRRITDPHVLERLRP